MLLGYPNTGKVDTYLIEKSCHRSIIRNAACGNHSALVKAVYKDCTLKEFVLVELINEIKKEVRQYAKDTECLLKLKSPEDIRKFSHLSLYHQLLLLLKVNNTCGWYILHNIFDFGKIYTHTKGTGCNNHPFQTI